MEKNIGKMDRVVRFLGGLLLLLAGVGVSNLILKWALIIFGAIGVVEGLVGRCYLYHWFNINTVKPGEKKDNLWKILSWLAIACAVIAYGTGWMALIEKREILIPNEFWFYDAISAGILGLVFLKLSSIRNK